MFTEDYERAADRVWKDVNGNMQHKLEQYYREKYQSRQNKQSWDNFQRSEVYFRERINYFILNRNHLKTYDSEVYPIILEKFLMSMKNDILEIWEKNYFIYAIKKIDLEKYK